MKLQEIIDRSLEIDLRQLKDADLIKEIQQCLRIDVDGIVGGETLGALADFKSREHLASPTLIGKTTARELLEEREEKDDGEPYKVSPSLNTDAGNKTGATMKLPTGELVYANQFVVPGIPLTWGEITKNCTRVPTTKEYVENAVRLTKVWGEVRDKFGSPIYITSGYRPPAVNRAVGGVSNSQHLYFRALDMQPINGEFRKLLEVMKASEFTGIGDAVFMGRNKGFFHGDIRPGSRTIFAY